jgi:hypothetical protein
LIILPGPAVIVVPLGLALLATEFAWARRLIRRGGVVLNKARRWRRRRPASPAQESLGDDAR